MKHTGLLLIFFLIFFPVFAQNCQNDSVGFIPINDLGDGIFNGKKGGLYGNGKNEMPDEHLKAGIAYAKKIRPLNAKGEADSAGKIGFISIGMSNANMFFASFKDSALAFADLNTKLVLANCAIGSKDIDNLTDLRDSYWTEVPKRLSQAGITAAQVQVVWFEQAQHITKIPRGEGIEHIAKIEEKFLFVFKHLKKIFPNLQQIFCSGRDYGNYGLQGRGNPEPYAYYTGWAFRNLVERQLNQDPLLRHDVSENGTVWLAWADYIWANGNNPRKDGFKWICPDDLESDGVHPSPTGRAKVAAMLMKFFAQDATTIWFKNLQKDDDNGDDDGNDDDNITSSELLDEKPFVKITPNPAKGIFSIDSEKIEIVNVQIFNSLGTQILESNKAQIDLSHFPNGVYMLKISDRQGRIFSESVFLSR